MIKRVYFGIALFDFTIYLSMISIWSGIQGMTGIAWLQYLLLGWITLNLIFVILASFVKIKPWAIHVSGGFSILFLIVLGYMFYLAIGSSRYIFRSFFEISMYLFASYAAYAFLFRFPTCHLAKNKTYKRILLGVVLALIVVVGFDLEFHQLTSGPVVYAVEDTYQIVWTTSTNAIARVHVGDTVYVDGFAGSERSDTTVHKIIVPMSELDFAQSYTISSTQVLYRGPYSGILGSTIEKTYDFFPVDLSDGLNYYTVSDIHEHPKAAIEAAKYYGDTLDFLVMAGDIVSHPERAEDAELIVQIAHAITCGSRPVVYARGNHEVKSDYADQLHRYVGSLNETFYYTFQLSGIFGIVLDLGEDHEDDWWEYYGTAHFEAYREDQTAFLNEVLADSAFDEANIEYRMAICHIPVTLVNQAYLEETQLAWTALLNQMDLDILVSGHKHQLLALTTDIAPNIVFEYHDDYALGVEAGYRTNANFVNFVAARRSAEQSLAVKESEFGRAYTGLAVSVDFNLQTMIVRFTNQSLAEVSTLHPTTGEETTEYSFDLD